MKKVIVGVLLAASFGVASADSIKLFSAMPVVYSGEQVTQDQAISIAEKTVYLKCNSLPVKAVISSNKEGNGNFVVDNFITLNKTNVCPDENNGACFSGITNESVWADIYYNKKIDSTAKALDVYGAINPIDVSSKLAEGNQFVEFNIMDMGVTSANSDVWLTTNCVSPPQVVVCHKQGTEAEKTLKVAQSAAHSHLEHGDKIGSCDLSE